MRPQKPFASMQKAAMKAASEVELRLSALERSLDKIESRDKNSHHFTIIAILISIVAVYFAYAMSNTYAKDLIEGKLQSVSVKITQIDKNIDELSSSIKELNKKKNITPDKTVGGTNESPQ